MRRESTTIRCALATALVLALAGTARAGTLDDEQARGVLKCAVNTGIAGFAHPDDAGEWNGFDFDFCRATAAAVLGDPKAIEAVTATGKTRFTKLNAAGDDVLWHNTTITFSPDVGVKLRFHGVNYHDGQGFMVRRDLGVSSATELDGAAICIQAGTTAELNIADYFNSIGMKYEAVTVATKDEARQNYSIGRCDVYTTDASGLAATRSTFTDPENHVLLPEIISKEPLNPATRYGADQWSDIVTWVLNATVTAEEMGIASANFDGKTFSEDSEVLRLLGLESNQGAGWSELNEGDFGCIYPWCCRCCRPRCCPPPICPLPRPILDGQLDGAMDDLLTWSELDSLDGFHIPGIPTVR